MFYRFWDTLMRDVIQIIWKRFFYQTASTAIVLTRK